MQKPLLESYECILAALVGKPLTFRILTYRSGLNNALLAKRLDFLVENGLIEERASDNRKIYAITEKGVAVFKALSFEKYIRQLGGTIQVVDEALQAIPEMSEGNHHIDKR